MRRNDTGASWIIRAHLFVPISLLAFLVVGCARSSVADRPTPTVPTATLELTPTVPTAALEPTPTVPTATLEPTPTPLSTASRAATPTIESSPTAAASESPQSRLSPTTPPLPTVFQFSQTIHATVAGATNQPLGAEEVTFVDQMHGWLVAELCYSGDSGVFATSDGGKSWSLQYRTPLSLEAPFFTDLNHGWIAANDCTWPADARPCSGSLLRTVDGGHSWTVDRMPNPVLQDLEFVNPTRGWAIGSNCSLPDNRCLTGLLATRDAGRSWQDVSPDHRAVSAVAFVDEKYGWIVACAAGSSGDIPPPCTGQQVLATTDGGNSWTRQFNLPDSPEPFHAYASFVDRQSGWILATRSGACTMGGCWGPLYHTSDGGLTWNLIPGNIRSGASAVAH